MKVYCVFDDFGEENCNAIRQSGIALTVQPKGKPRPAGEELKKILHEYDGIIIGTGQKMRSDYFSDITTPKTIVTASAGTDHIQVPESKKSLVTICNTPSANSQSVAEYVLACFLSRLHRLMESDKKIIRSKPNELCGKVVGIVGAGNVALQTATLLQPFHTKLLFWTPHPENHEQIKLYGGGYKPLDELLRQADCVLVCIPSDSSTAGFFSAKYCGLLSDLCIFVGVSRLSVYDADALFKKATEHPQFSLFLDIDHDERVIERAKPLDNVFITPHIAGGTTESRKRMFSQCAKHIANHFLNRRMKNETLY